MRNSKKGKHRYSWGRIALFSFCLLIAVGWVVFDSLFAPFGVPAVTVEIPALCGMDYDQIEFADWMQVELEYRYDASTPAGRVLAQTPVGGSFRKLTEATPTCKLSLVVSLGEETCALPNVLGEDVRSAEARLREMGFSVRVTRVEGAYPEGEVFGMEPRAGTVLPKGASVELTVSAGLHRVSVQVPDVRGLSRSDALVQLWLAQLAVGQVTEEFSDAVPGTVIRQSHQPGTLVTAGTKVNLYVSRDWEE